MGVLESVLAYKAQKEAQQNADINAIPQAVSAFTAGRQQAQKSQLDMLTSQIAAAKSGLRIGQDQSGNYTLTPDQGLLDGMQKQTGVFSFNPTTGQLEQVGAVGKGSVVRNTTTTDDIEDKENAKYGAKKQTADRAFGLRQELQALPTVKDYQVIKNQVASMDSLLEKIDTTGDKDSALALDQGLITLFNKITDPTSVVRESEYERTPQNLSLGNRFGGAIEKLKKGGAGLTSDDRKALVFGAKVIADSRGKLYNETLDHYESLSNEFGVKPELVTSGYGKHTDFLSAVDGSVSGSDGALKVGGTFQGGTIKKVTLVKK